jgi:GNAT superfamily N-acetyltransferase
MAVAVELPAVDVALARRLERAEGIANASAVEARRRFQPQSDADWTEIAGVYAMFDGASSFITQTFGIGLFEPFLDAQFDRVEAFFTQRGSSTFHEVSSFAAHETISLLGPRGYTPFETSTVLIRPTSNELSAGSNAITVRAIDETELSVWSRIAGEGWSSESPEAGEFVAGLGDIWARAEGITCFLAERDGEPIASAAMSLSNGVALMAGASTIPSARKQGAQLALLEARLRFAAERRADLAMVVTAPGSASQRNAERQGFRPVYTRAKWRRDI